MNVHISDTIRRKWPQYEFVGKPLRRGNGKTYIKAKRKHWPYADETHTYCMEDDFFWHTADLNNVP